MYNLDELKELKDKFPKGLTTAKQRMVAVQKFLKYLANESPDDHREIDLICELESMIHYLKFTTLKYVP